MTGPARRILSAAVIILVLALVGPVWAGGAQGQSVKLFKDYVWGTPRTQMLALPGVRECSGPNFPDGLCIDEIQFAGRKWAIKFGFNFGKLTHVVVGKPFSNDDYLTMLRVLDKRMIICYAESASDKLDVVTLETQHRSQLKPRLVEFERSALRTGRLAWSFVDGDGVPEAYQRSKNMFELVENSPMTVRQAALSVLMLNKDKFLTILFTAPKLERELAGKKSEKKAGNVEKF